MRSLMAPGSSYSTRCPPFGTTSSRAFGSASAYCLATSTGTIASSAPWSDEGGGAHLAQQRGQAAAEHVRLPAEPRRHLAAVVPELLVGPPGVVAEGLPEPVLVAEAGHDVLVEVDHHLVQDLALARLMAGRADEHEPADALLAHRRHLGGHEPPEAEPHERRALEPEPAAGPAGAGWPDRAARAPTPPAPIGRSRACRARTRWPARRAARRRESTRGSPSSGAGRPPASPPRLSDSGAARPATSIVCSVWLSVAVVTRAPLEGRLPGPGRPYST